MESIRGFFRLVQTFFRGVGAAWEAIEDAIDEFFRRRKEIYEENVNKPHGPDCPRCGGTGQDRFPPFGPCPRA